MIINFSTPAFILLFLDGLYLTFVQVYFAKQIAEVQGIRVRPKSRGAIISYLFLLLGLYKFIIYEKKSVFDAFLLGIVIYGVFEGTNYALLKKWRFSTVIIDTLWGGVLFALTTYLSYKLKDKMNINLLNL